ncbi:MAG: hypothetical protein EBT03_10505 [Betaproteobacteria bacterium]|nr:hypothetical protein [Betaproteobacteria bacterium]
MQMNSHFIVDALILSWVGGIHNRRVLGIYDDESEALEAAYKFSKKSGYNTQKVRVVRILNPYTDESVFYTPPEVIVHELIPRLGREPLHPIDSRKDDVQTSSGK